MVAALNWTTGLFARFVDELADVADELLARKSGQAGLTLVERGDEYAIIRTGGEAPEVLAQGSLASLASDALPPAARGQPLDVRLDGARMISKTLQLPAASRDYLHAVVTHQLDRITPWAADRVVYDYALAEGEAAGSDQIAVRLVAMSRDAFGAALARLAAAGIDPLAIGSSGDPIDRPSPVNLLRGKGSGRRDELRRKVTLGLAALVAAGVVLGALSSWRLHRLNARASTVQAELTEARNGLEALRSVDAEGQAKLLERKTAALPAVILLDRLSQAVPASTYLSQLAVEGESLRVSGLSGDAPALIGLLEETDILDGVSFAAPTIRDNSAARDRFEITARIVPAPTAMP